MADDVQKSIVLDFTYTTDTYDLFTQAEVYGKVITKMAEADKNIVVLTSDMTRSNKTGDFKKTFPDRFFNFGIAEANMFAASAGMAICGKIPFVTTFAVFASLRCAEMIRTDIAYPNFRSGSSPRTRGSRRETAARRTTPPRTSRYSGRWPT